MNKGFWRAQRCAGWEDAVLCWVPPGWVFKAIDLDALRSKKQILPIPQKGGWVGALRRPLCRNVDLNKDLTPQVLKTPFLG